MRARLVLLAVVVLVSSQPVLPRGAKPAPPSSVAAEGRRSLDECLAYGRTAIECFALASSYFLELCGLQTRAELLNVEMGATDQAVAIARVAACLDHAADTLDVYFEAAMKQTGKDWAAAAMLRHCILNTRTALESMAPRPGESPAEHRERMQAARDQTDALHAAGH